MNKMYFKVKISKYLLVLFGILRASISEAALSEIDTVESDFVIFHFDLDDSNKISSLLI